MPPADPAAPDFLPTASWRHLELRARLLRQLRHFFDTRGFLEVDTPLLSHDTVVDEHIEPIAVSVDPAGADGPMWLQTSPEFGMKRLLAAGGQAIYQVTKAFRAGERGRLHNIEFTLVEWYRVGDAMVQGMDLLDELVQQLLDRGRAERITFREAFQRHTNLDPHAASAEQLQAAAARLGAAPLGSADSHDTDTWLDLLLVQCVEPHLGRGRPTIVYDYPASRAALAKLRDERPPVAERFELYVDGIELANGYHELQDAQLLLQRFRQANQRRAAAGKPQLPEQSRLLSAMQHGLPPCCGVAMGFDRLVMLAAGVSSIDDVMALPFERA